MSTRWYPLYQRGNPQLRVFLPNFWMKLIRPTRKQPENVVQFICSMQMTKFDVKQYLEKIYNIQNIENVYTRIASGKLKRAPGRAYIIKEDDVKMAYVVLPRTEKFVFPDLFSNIKERDEDMESIDDSKKKFREYLENNKDRPGVPNWFSL